MADLRALTQGSRASEGLSKNPRELWEANRAQVHRAAGLRCTEQAVGLLRSSGDPESRLTP